MINFIRESINRFFKPLLRIRTFLRHLYFAIRYGEWDAGWDKYWLTKPDHEWFYCGHIYYEGDHAAIRIGKFFIGVSY